MFEPSKQVGLDLNQNIRLSHPLGNIKPPIRFLCHELLMLKKRSSNLEDKIAYQQMVSIRELKVLFVRKVHF